MLQRGMECPEGLFLPGSLPRAARLSSNSRQSMSGKATLVQLPLLLLPAYFQGACLKDPHKQEDILHRGEGSLFVGLLFLMVSTRACWLSKHLGNISIPLRDPNVQSKAVTHSSQWWRIMDATILHWHSALRCGCQANCTFCLGTRTG